jgi:hypothetical protein
MRSIGYGEGLFQQADSRSFPLTRNSLSRISTSPHKRGEVSGMSRCYLSSQIRHYRIEHRKSRLRHAQPAAGVDHDGAFFAQHRNAAGIERAAR